MAIHFPTVQWASTATMYEVNIRQYTPEGTFNAFKKHLPRLRDMGIDILWFMPITPISKEIRQGELGSYYACSSYTEINPEFGVLEDFKSLVDEAHQLGFKVIIDWVANHTGWDHPWTKTNPDWYMKDAAGNFTEANGWHDVIDLNFTNTNMRKALIAAMQYWIKECNIDGFRCDMAHLVPLDFWKEARIQCDNLKQLFWLAECEVMEYHNVFDISYSWDLMHVTEEYFKGCDSLNKVYDVLHKYSQYPVGTKKLFFTSNHDENSWNGSEYEKYGQAAKAMAVFTATWNGMPLVYSGQESPNKKRLQFFDKDLIEWNNPPQLHGFYKTILSLHKTKAVTEGETFILPTGNAEVMAYMRRKGVEVMLVLLNLSSKARMIFDVQHEWLHGKFENTFSGLTYQFNQDEKFELQAYEYLIYYKKQ
jgi:glycosidase